MLNGAARLWRFCRCGLSLCVAGAFAGALASGLAGALAGNITRHLDILIVCENFEREGVRAVVGLKDVLLIAMLEQDQLRHHLDEVPEDMDVGMIESDRLDQDPVNADAFPQLDFETPVRARVGDVEEDDRVQVATDGDHLVCDNRVEVVEEGWQLANSLHWLAHRYAMVPLLGALVANALCSRMVRKCCSAAILS